jgi:NitT/TauT family transport system ATP-binding protein
MLSGKGDERSEEVLLQVKGIKKRFGALNVIDDLVFDLKKGEILCILGPSGCGKTTILRIIAGLEEPSGGEICLEGKTVDGPGPNRGMVFQDPALFPWRDSLKNVEFGLEIKGLGKEERERIAKESMELVGLEDFSHSYPYQLSGGMQQRVGLARALANDPEILLMDEPFGALDAQTRNSMQGELLRIWEETEKTIIFVTHSVDEAIYLGDRILVLSPRPTSIKREIGVGMDRPRDRTGKRFNELRKGILELLKSEG